MNIAQTRCWPRPTSCRGSLPDLYADPWNSQLGQFGSRRRGGSRAALPAPPPYLKKASWRPASTLMIWPVVLLNLLLTSRYATSAWSCGVTGAFISVRWA